MNLKLYIILTAVVLSFVGPASADHLASMETAVADHIATVHGAVYRWDTFEPLDNTVVDVNSTPPQSMLAKKGKYSVELVPGNYTIAARYYQNGIFTYSTEVTIEIKDGDDYVLDLLLYPVDSKRLMDGSNINKQSGGPITENSKPKGGSQVLSKTGDIPVLSDLSRNSQTLPTKQSRFYSLIASYLLIVLLFLLFIGGYLLAKKHRKIEKNTSEKGKKGHIIRDFFERSKMPKISAKVRDKSIGLKKREPAESKEEYPAQETELVEFRSEEDTKKTFHDESACNPKIETHTLKNKFLLPAYLQEVMEVIRSEGGQIKQKDLRSRLKYSEVKVSLILSDLENRKKIKKVKVGRENIVVLID